MWPDQYWDTATGGWISGPRDISLGDGFLNINFRIENLLYKIFYILYQDNENCVVSIAG